MINAVSIDSSRASELVSLPVEGATSGTSLDIFIAEDLRTRLIAICGTAFDPALMAQSIGTRLHAVAQAAAEAELLKIVDELPLRQFAGWSDPTRGGVGDHPSSAAT